MKAVWNWWAERAATVSAANGRPLGRLPLEVRFEWNSVPEPNTGCWLWLGTISNVNGYGSLRYRGSAVYAHRAAYTLFRGPIPDDYEIDHLCRTRWCVNPAHLEAVERLENIRRAAAHANAAASCPRGHAFSAANTGINNRGTRYCKECNRLKARAHRALRKHDARLL